MGKTDLSAGHEHHSHVQSECKVAGHKWEQWKWKEPCCGCSRHGVFLCMVKCRALIFQVMLLLTFLFLNKKFCIEKVSFDFLFHLQMQSWASFRFCAFLRNMPRVTEIGQPGSSFPFSHPNQRFPILQTISN